MEIVLEYKTHKIILSEISYFTKITNYVEGDVYQDMVSAIISDDKKAFNFVRSERILLNNFLQSLISFHNRGDIVAKGGCPIIISFQEEIDYYSYCVDHNLPFKEQEWFKTAYIKASIKDAETFLNNASVSLIRYVYPSYIETSYKIIDYTPVQKEQQSEYKYLPADYQSFLDEKSISCLYHFSDYKNLASIKEYGICSIKYLQDNKILVNYASSKTSRELDVKNNLQDYVHLSYERNNPMLFIALAEGRLANYVIFEVNTDVLFLKDTLYTHCNAAKKGTKFYKDISAFLEIPFDKFHNKQYDKNSVYKDYFMSEVLVKDRISPSHILKVVY